MPLILMIILLDSTAASSFGLFIPKSDYPI
jgi:hypothetical protein